MMRYIMFGDRYDVHVTFTHLRQRAAFTKSKIFWAAKAAFVMVYLKLVRVVIIFNCASCETCIRRDRY